MSDCADVGVVGPQRLLADGQAALVERLGLGVAALVPIQLGQIVERSANIGWSGPSAFSRMARLRLIERLGLGVAALVWYSTARLLSDRANVGVLGPQRLLGDGEAALVERLGLGIAALARYSSARLLSARRRRGGRAQRLLADGQDALVERLGLGVAALHPVQPGQAVERCCHVRVLGSERLLVDGEHRLAISVASAYLPARYSLITSALSAAASSPFFWRGRR